MRVSTARSLPMLAAAALSIGAPGSPGSEGLDLHPVGDFVCATPHADGSDDASASLLGPAGAGHASGGPLAKQADLPRISKVYAGKSAAVMIRIAFTDAPYAVSDSAIARTHATVNNLFRDMSRNTFEFEFKVHPEVWTAPGTAAQYGADFKSLQAFISAKLKENGYSKLSTTNPSGNYSVYVANFPRIGVSWAGLSNGPGSGANYVNGSYSSGVTAHELGHAVGLPHASSIEAGTDPFGAPGTSGQHVEYGNPFDVMGSAVGLGHFNINYKWRTGWVDKEEALEVKSTGVYRLHAHDNPAHKGRLLAIRVPSQDSRYAYWFEYRSASSTARNGAVVMFEGFLGTGSRNLHLIDMTPESRSRSDAQDAVLVPGKEFKDAYGTALFKVLAINSGVWNEDGWVDVQVNIPGTQPLALGRPANRMAASRSAPAKVHDVMGRLLAATMPARALAVDATRKRLVATDAAYLPSNTGEANR